jgi:hypothetical protein
MISTWVKRHERDGDFIGGYRLVADFYRAGVSDDAGVGFFSMADWSAGGMCSTR